MFVLVGTDGTDLKYVKDEARSLNEKYRVHDQPHWFTPKEGDPVALSSDDAKRITFRGHGSKKKFGGYTPESFFAMLKERQNTGDFPNTIETIDLIGCGIGYKFGNNKCWIEKFSELLNADESFKHIKSINGLMYHDDEKKFAKMISVKGSLALLFTKKDYEEYKVMSETLKINQGQKEKLSHEIEIKEQEIESSIEYKLAREDTKDHKEKMKKMITDTFSTYMPTEKEGQEYKVKMLKLLDDNKFLAIKNGLLQKNRPSDFPKQEAIAIRAKVDKLKELRAELKKVYVKLDNGYIKEREALQDQLDNKNKEILMQLPKISTFLGATTENPRVLVQRFPNITRVDENPLVFNGKKIELPDNSELIKLIEKSFASGTDESERIKFVLKEDTELKAGLKSYLDYVRPENNKWQALKAENTLHKTSDIAQKISSPQEMRTTKQDKEEVEPETPRIKMRH